jgi:hypothetical protein
MAYEEHYEGWYLLLEVKTGIETAAFGRWTGVPLSK